MPDRLAGVRAPLRPPFSQKATFNGKRGNLVSYPTIDRRAQDPDGPCRVQDDADGKFAFEYVSVSSEREDFVLPAFRFRRQTA